MEIGAGLRNKSCLYCQCSNSRPDDVSGKIVIVDNPAPIEDVVG